MSGELLLMSSEPELRLLSRWTWLRRKRLLLDGALNCHRDDDDHDDERCRAGNNHDCNRNCCSDALKTYHGADSSNRGERSGPSRVQVLSEHCSKRATYIERR